MKQLIVFLISILSLLPIGNAQENCNPYYSLQEGKKWTIKSYNAKDKYQGSMSYEVLSIKEEDGTYTYTVKYSTTDKKEKEVQEQTVEFKCTDGVMEMDISSILPAETMQSLEDMNFEIEMDRISIPEELEVGQTLDDGFIKMSMSNPIPMKIVTTIKDRKIVSEEAITVPAGTFDAYKLTYITVTQGMGNKEFKSVEYIAEGIGVVRSETFDKNGALDSYSVLFSYSE